MTHNNVPVPIVKVLTEQGNWCLSVVKVQLGHVEVVNKVNELLLTWWSVVLASFLGEWSIEDVDQHVGISVVIEINSCTAHSHTARHKVTQLHGTKSHSCTAHSHTAARHAVTQLHGTAARHAVTQLHGTQSHSCMEIQITAVDALVGIHLLEHHSIHSQ